MLNQIAGRKRVVTCIRSYKVTIKKVVISDRIFIQSRHQSKRKNPYRALRIVRIIASQHQISILKDIREHIHNNNL